MNSIQFDKKKTVSAPKQSARHFNVHQGFTKVRIVFVQSFAAVSKFGIGKNKTIANEYAAFVKKYKTALKHLANR